MPIASRLVFSLAASFLMALAACSQPAATKPAVTATREEIPKATCPHVPPPPPGSPPKPPVSSFPQTLQAGHWEWDDGGYVWTPPRWHTRFTATPPVWRDGYWAADGIACVWHIGHFLPNAGHANS